MHDYIPGRFQVVRHVRPKYACKRCDAIAQAPAPNLPIPRGRATPSLLAMIVMSKYLDYLPLYRQSEIYARECIDLPRSTLADYAGQAAWLLTPIADGIRAHVFTAEKIHGDGTPVAVLAPGLGRTRTDRLWTFVRDDRPFCGTAPRRGVHYAYPFQVSGNIGSWFSKPVRHGPPVRLIAARTRSSWRSAARI
ncbi:transposase [Acidiphilium sp. AL]|uniref:IS66 family transposase n=1 Tax=Acidiphilium TaxID=522 RepID=UPI0038B30BB0|nr:transposase [Acidiphilium sp. AL]